MFIAALLAVATTGRGIERADGPAGRLERRDRVERGTVRIAIDALGRKAASIAETRWGETPSAPAISRACTPRRRRANLNRVL